MVRSLCEGFLDLVYPRRCLHCKTQLKGIASVDNAVCAACWSKIKKNPPPFCHSCGRHLEPKTAQKNLCRECLKRQYAFDRAFCPCPYEGVLKGLICEFKYRQRDYLGGLLSRPMIDFIREYHVPIEFVDAILPIPLAGERLREREFNQAHSLGQAIARAFDKRLLSSVLVRSRPTLTQTELPPDARFANVRNSFAVKNPESIKDKNVLLIDDVLTTGATVSEAASVLKQSGARIVFVMTLAN